jgi:hypothetical protein
VEAVRDVTGVAVILGASGRLGRRLLPAFAAAGFHTIGVSRASRIAHPPNDGQWITADLTVPVDRVRTAGTIGAHGAGHQRLCIVDVVLDRCGVDAMKDSVHGATDTVVRLRDQLSGTAIRTVLVAASTTAVLAPRVLQTPYGLAKRRQVITYTRAGVAGVAWLLPLLGQPGTPQTANLQYPAWSFDEAAARLASIPATTWSGDAFAVRIPAVTVPGTSARTAPVRPKLLSAHVNSLLADRDSMQAHRDAARARLCLSPGSFRSQVDHHLAPARLVDRFADRYDITVIDERVTDPRTDGDAGHA